MRRSPQEVEEEELEKKSVERKEQPFLVKARLSFEALAARDAAIWKLAGSQDHLKRLVEKVKQELIEEDFPLFVRRICELHGAALAREVGLPVGNLGWVG